MTAAAHSFAVASTLTTDGDVDIPSTNSIEG
jgi:hypothetical protein